MKDRKLKIVVATLVLATFAVIGYVGATFFPQTVGTNQLAQITSPFEEDPLGPGQVNKQSKLNKDINRIYRLNANIVALT